MFVFLFQVQCLVYCQTQFNKYTYDQIDQHARLLQNSTQNVTDYDWDYLRLSIQFIDDNLPTNYSTYMRRVFATSQLFFQKYLLVRRTQQLLQWNTDWGSSIYNIKIPDRLLQQQYDADYVLFVDVQYLTTASYLTYCGSVQFDNITKRPIFGMLSWNLAYMTISNETDAQFEMSLDIGLHVLMNAFGFQVGNFLKFYDSATGQPYINPILTQVGRTYYLSTPRITQYVRDYFNCTTLQGALLENNGGNGIALNNLERTVFYKEIMTASELVGDMYLTDVTMQFLQDTGYYRLTEYNADEQTWGKNKGCSFVTQQCNQPGFDEFCQINSPESCSQDYEGVSVCSFDYFSNRCSYQQIKPQYECRDSTNQLNSPDRGVFDYFGYNSMCFNGSLTQNASALPSACYKFSCDQSGNLTIIIDQKQYSCSQNSSFSPEGYNGTVYCPADQKWFCDNQDDCPNYCNKNGICFGGKCICALGFGGLGCDVECLYYRFKDQCLTFCPDGYYARDDISYCIGCPANCKTCQNYKSCQECNLGYRLRGGFCDYSKVQFTLADVADVADLTVINNTVQDNPQIIEDTPQIVNSSYQNISIFSLQQATNQKNQIISEDLLQIEWKNIRIAYDFLKPYNRWLTNFVTQAFEIVDIFLSKQILVRPSQTKLQFIQGWNTLWLGQQIPDNIQKKTYDADIVYLISLDYNTGSNQSFNSAPIYGDLNFSGRPIFSIILFNMAKIDITNLSNDQYQQLLQMICKQVLIGLGLHRDSINLYFDSATGKSYKQIAQYENQILYLATPRLYKYGQTHFNCYDLPGIRIENQSTFAQSQVGRELLSDADPAQNLLLSQFTFSLLQDTGYYRITELLPDVNIWGMKKGCDFTINTCNSTKSYFKEFCYNSSKPQSCSFDRAGISKCVINQQDKCGYQVITKSCKDSTNQDINYYQQYGFNSICLFTNLTNQPNICLRYNCTEIRELNLTITNQTVCTQRSQILAPENINFNITCPSNPQTYCNFQNDCPSQCTQRGYCMGGRCTCLWGYSGLGCEQSCSGFRYHDQCIKECPLNTFASTDTQYCIGCPSNCIQCASHNKCDVCQKGYVPRGGFCDYQYSDREQSQYSIIIAIILYQIL